MVHILLPLKMAGGDILLITLPVNNWVLGTGVGFTRRKNTKPQNGMFANQNKIHALK